VVGHLVDPLAIRRVAVPGALHRIGHDLAGVQIRSAERKVVLEEVDVPHHVAHHQLLIGEAVALQQIGVRRIAVDDHLVNLREAILVALAQPFVLHAEAPMRVAIRETAVRGDLVHHVVAEHLEHDWEEVEPVAPGDLLDLLLLDLRYRGSDVFVANCAI